MSFSNENEVAKASTSRVTLDHNQIVNPDDLGSDVIKDGDTKTGSNAVMKGDQPEKRQKTAVASTTRKRTVASFSTQRKSKKSLSLLPTMPFDVLFEILGQLTAKDLLNVSRTNKLFHETLTSSGAKMVWNHALQGQAMPKCPRDLTGTRWTTLLVGSVCEGCGTRNCRRVDFYIRHRICRHCTKSHLLSKSKVQECFPDYDEIILGLIPYTPRGGLADVNEISGRFYWKSDVEHIIAVYNKRKIVSESGDVKALDDFLNQRMALVLEICTNVDKCEAWLAKAASERLKENTECRNNRYQAIRSKFLELGYDDDDIERIEDHKECKQKTALTEKIWKRIRPKLEESVKERREARIQHLTIENSNKRRYLFIKCYEEYQLSIPASQWKYLPHVIELIGKDPFKAVIESPYNVSITEADFAPLMLQIPQMTAEICDELKAGLIEQLAHSAGPSCTISSNCLELAKSVFRCCGDCVADICVIGTDSILSHNCGDYTFQKGYRLFNAHSTRRFLLHPEGISIAKSLVLCAGLDPKTALASDMDVKDLRFACASGRCATGGPLGYSWRSAIFHWLREHRPVVFYSEEEGVVNRTFSKTWRLLSSAEADVVKQNEENDEKWGRAEWQCSRCSFALKNETSGKGMYRKDVVQHVQTVHSIASPSVPDDLFYFEKIVAPFRDQHKLVYEL
ncbi:hypothetical protein BDN70DRAFT_881554 [Pholiota conissans]|uniref:F-box domain-containing protein n=1 Tax=Pholiota conissans TaxID=109636 RepID=A0A9P5YXZ5_9AGAR|nr:hypothetical protein BDN70DRAFT_881554 [Pholiota conissans]